MSHPDHVALQNSDLNAFLYADVGTELNGSTLTMLSVLARLDKDPWIEAARWARLPKAAAVDGLIPIIDAIPLSPQSPSGTRAAAARLVMLLPASEWRAGLTAPSLTTKTAARAFGASLDATATALPRWLPMAVLAFALLLGAALHLVHPPTASNLSTELTQTKVKPPAAETR